MLYLAAMLDFVEIVSILQCTASAQQPLSVRDLQRMTPSPPQKESDRYQAVVQLVIGVYGLQHWSEEAELSTTYRSLLRQVGVGAA